MGQPIRILLVDDERISREVAAHLLKSGGYEVTTASLPSEAIEIYKEHQDSFDVVVLDMLMPEMTGKELFVELKAMNPGIKAILLSGFGKNTDLKEALDLGVCQYLQKPVSRQILLDTVLEIANQ